MSALSNSRTRLIIAVVVVAIVIGVVAFQFLSTQKPSTPTPTGFTLVILTRHDTTIWEGFEGPFLASDFAKQNGVTDIEWLQPDASFWKQVIERGDKPVDVAWGGGPTLFDQLVRDNLLSPLDDPSLLQTVDGISDTIGGAPMKRKDASGQIVWVAAAISSFGFTVNHDFLRRYNLPAPQKWEDLASVEYAKLLPTASISMGNAPQTTSNTRIYEIILQAFGWEKGWSIMARMAGNSQIYSGSVETQQAVEIGEVGVGMSIDFYGYTTQLRNPSTEYVLPEGQSIINGDPIALAKSTQHKQAAQAFINFVLSPEGQSLWLSEKVNRMPVRAEAFQTELGKKRPDLERVYQKTIANIGIPFEDPLALSYEASIRTYFQAVFTDAHAELVAAWKAIVEAKTAGRINDQQLEQLAARLGGPVKWTQDGKDYTFTLEYAQSINSQMLSDAAFSNMMLSIWRNAAITMYNQILSQLS